MFSHDYDFYAVRNALISQKGVAAADSCGRFAVHAGSGFGTGSFAAKTFCVCRGGKIAKSVFCGGNVGDNFIGSGNKNYVFRSVNNGCNTGSGSVNIINFSVFGNCVCACKEKISKKCFSSCGFNLFRRNNMRITVIIISVFKKFDDAGFMKSSRTADAAY